jgi:predicted Zn finger-like uncharacterized protein
MNVSCGSCPAKYAVPDEKVRGRKVRITCKRCGAAIIVDGTAGDGAMSQSVVPAPQPAQADSAARPAVAVPSLGGGVSPVAGRAMKRTMLGIPGPAADAAPAPPAPAPIARAAQPAVAAPTAHVAPSATRDAKPQASGQSSMSFAKRTMVGGMTAPAPKVQAPPQPAPPPVEWTVAVTDEHHVPMAIVQIIEAYATGRIDAETFIWKEGMPDWLMPFEIPEIESALRAKGFRPSKLVQPPPRALADYDHESQDKPTAVSDSPFESAVADAGGMWREPGRWNEPGSPFGGDSKQFDEPGENRDLPSFGGPSGDAVSFDDVTVAMRAPEAEKLLREAADQSGARMVGEAEAEARFAPVDPFDNRFDIHGVDPTDATVRYDKSTAPELAELPRVGALPAEALSAPRAPRPAAPVEPPVARVERPVEPPVARVERPVEPPAEPRAERLVARAATRKTAEAPAGDLFAKAAAADSPSDDTTDADKENAPRMTGARNESSVLFSLEAMMKGDKGKPKAAESKTEEDSLLGTGGTPSRDMRLGTALAAPDFSAPVAEAPPPIRATAAAPTTPLPEAKTGGGWLWAALVLLALAGAAVALWMLKPAWIAPYLPGASATQATPTAEPAPTTPSTPAPETAAAAPTDTAATPAASASAPAAPATPGAVQKSSAEKRAAAAAPEKKAAAGAAEAPAAEPAAAALPPFDREAAAAALTSAAANATSCKQPDGPAGAGKATVTFAPSGRATNATVTGDLAGTAVGGCVARLFRQARVPAFSGDPITVAKGFSIQ